MYEIEILRKYSHKCLQKLKAVYESTDYVHLVFHRTPGGLLLDEIKKWSIYTEYDVRLIMKSLLEGVSYLHNHSVLHRYIIPQNIFLMYVFSRSIGNHEIRLNFLDCH